MLKSIICDALFHPSDRSWSRLEGVGRFQHINPAAIQRMWHPAQAETYMELASGVVLRSSQSGDKVRSLLWGDGS